MKKHFATLFASQSNIHPWQRMIACGLATGCPLLLGLLKGLPALAVYGALTGYLLALNDHFGGFVARLGILTATYILFISCFALGHSLQPNDAAFQIIVAGTVYWLGLLGGRGAELERGVLFAVLVLVIAFATPTISADVRMQLAFFSGVGYLSLLAAIALLFFVNRSPPERHLTLRDAARFSLTLDLEKHAHALSYSLMTLSSIWLGELFAIERSYWITITVLLIMRPDRTLSLYMTAQRLIGTVLAVVLASPALTLMHNVPAFALIASLSAAAVPWGARRNYFWVSFFATILVISLLEIASESHRDMHLPIVRLQATAIGCLLALLGTGLSKLFDVLRARKHL